MSHMYHVSDYGNNDGLSTTNSICIIWLSSLTDIKKLIINSGVEWHIYRQTFFLLKHRDSIPIKKAQLELR